MDFEFDVKATVLSLVFSAMFLFMIWKTAMWADYNVLHKIIMSIVVIPMLYMICLWQLNR